MAGDGFERNAEIMPAAFLGAGHAEQMAPRREEGRKGASAEGRREDAGST